LRRGRDVWGERLIRSGGATYERVRRHLTPLFLARGPRRRPLTRSGVHYLAFAMPSGGYGAGSVALHVADGSQLIADRANGRSVTLFVGERGRERYGACRTRLAEPSLRDGYLPILETQYRDAAGVVYSQESFAARVPETRSLVSFVRVTADATAPEARSSRIRFVGSRAARLFHDGADRARAGALEFDVPRGTTRTVHVAWLNYRAASRTIPLDAEAFDRVRTSVERYWAKRLSDGSEIVVPDERVMDALRNLLIQNLNHLWRYSIGNQYEEFSFTESVATSQVMGELGFHAAAERIMRTSLTRDLGPRPRNWKLGEALVGSARHWELFRNRAYIRRATPFLARHLDRVSRQLASSRRGLLARDTYSNDVHHYVYALHGQAAVWQGLNGMARVWAEVGRPRLAARARVLARRLEHGLRRAVGRSQRRLPDGTLFIPMRLLDGEQPYGAITGTRRGSYWNLVAPRAFSSGLFRPGSTQMRGGLAYMERHGAWLLGLVRGRAFSLYGRRRAYPAGGTVQVYGVDTARFLATNGRSDRLALSLYGHLAAGMNPSTFVSGEAASVAPIARAYHRSMYLPPNAASNAAFLAALRLMLVHETRDRVGAPVGLELAHSTHRHWLAPGHEIAVRDVPTAFGPVSYGITTATGELLATVDVPERRPRRLTLRLRLPEGSRIAAVTVNGAVHPYFDPRTETIDLSGLSGRLELVAETTDAP
jgi:hypothetical protein